MLILQLSTTIFCQEDKKSPIDARLKRLTEDGERPLTQLYDTLNYLLSETKIKDDYIGQIKVLTYFSSVALKRTRDFELASEYLEEIKQLAEVNDNDPWGLARYHNGLGVLYFTEGVDRSRAYEEFRRSQEIIRKNKLRDDPSLLNNFALALMNGGEVEESLKTFKLARIKYHQSGETDLTFEFNNILNQGVNFIYLDMADSANYYFNDALRFSINTSTKIDDFEARVYLGVYLQESGDYKKAVGILREAEKYLPSINGFNLKVLLYEALALSEESLGNYREAYEAMNSVKLYTDSLDLKGYAEQTLKFDYRRELDSLHYAQDLFNLNAAAEEEKLNSRIFILVLSLLLAIGGFLFIIYRLNKRKQLNYFLAENERLEKEKIKREKELELLHKNQEIVSKDIELSVRSDEMENLKKMLQSHLDNSDDPNFNELKSFLNSVKHSEKKVAQLDLLNEILSVNSSDFLKGLKEKFPDLTDDELRLLSLIRLNLSSEELMLVFNISKPSLNTKRYRVRKKIGLSKSDSLERFVLDF